MSLYKYSRITGPLDLSRRSTTTEVNINYRHGIYSNNILQGLPVLTNYFKCIYYSLNANVLANCKYMCQIDIKYIHCKNTIHRLPMRLVSLRLEYNGIYSISNSHSYLMNTKQYTIPRLPNKLLELNLSNNSIFRVTTNSSLREAIFMSCSQMNYVIMKESILSVYFHMTYNKKPNSIQKSISFIEMCFHDIRVSTQYTMVCHVEDGPYNEISIIAFKPFVRPKELC